MTSRIKGLALLCGLLLGLAIDPGRDSGAAEPSYNAAVEAIGEGDYETALANLLPLSEAGDPNAQFTLAFLYDFGQGVEESPEEAAYWYGQASLADLPVSQFTLAGMYEIGRGVERDPVKAYYWYSRAIDNLSAGETRDTVADSRDAMAERLNEAQLAEVEAGINNELDPRALVPRRPGAAPEPAPSQVAKQPEPESAQPEPAPAEETRTQRPATAPEPEPEVEAPLVDSAAAPETVELEIVQPELERPPEVAPGLEELAGPAPRPELAAVADPEIRAAPVGLAPEETAGGVPAPDSVDRTVARVEVAAAPAPEPAPEPAAAVEAEPAASAPAPQIAEAPLPAAAEAPTPEPERAEPVEPEARAPEPALVEAPPEPVQKPEPPVQDPPAEPAAAEPAPESETTLAEILERQQRGARPAEDAASEPAATQQAALAEEQAPAGPRAPLSPYAEETVFILERRLATLGRISEDLETASAAAAGWQRLESWEAETRRLLETRIGRGIMFRFDAARDGALRAGDPVGNVNRSIRAYKGLLIEVLESIRGNPSAYASAP